MKKSKIIILIASIILVALTVVAVAAATISESTLGIIDAIINGEDYDVEKDLNGDQKIDILDVILGVKKDNFKGPKLQTLTLDGGYAVEEEVEFDNFTYTVQLPAGRPRIPHITATAESGDAVVAYQNATIADNETSGYAKVIISDESGENVYTVKFVRDEVVDKVVLQYDDRWTFTPDYELKDGEAFTFESTDSSVASVDNNGVITAENVSTEAVVISAMVGETVVDTFTVSKIDKAVINLFLVTGQSNAQGCYDYEDKNNKVAEANEQLKDVIQPEKAGQVYIYDAYPYWNSYNVDTFSTLQGGLSAFYDLYDVKRAGFASALGKTYYELSGEKVVFLHGAYSGAPIERWLDPSVHGSLAEADSNYYVGTKNGYTALMALLDENLYEINHRANFWLQGETCMGSIWDYNGGSSGKGDWRDPTAYEKLFSSEDYTDMFMKVHNQLKNDFQIETNNILLVRAHGSIVKNADGNIKAALNNVRSSQYGMANTNSEITIVSRLSDWVVPYNAKYIGTPYEAYNGLMGVGNVHYNQTGHNQNGIIAATNYFKKLDVDTTSIATSVEIIDTDGIKRFDENEAIGEFEVGKTKRIAAFPLPEYSLENVTYSSSNKEIANVNEFGLITIVGVGEATITATAESGVSASIVVKGIERTTAPTKFTLDEFATKTIASYLPEFRFADITYTSDNEDVATVNDKGLITVVGGGEANIKATSKTGAYEEFVITGIAQQIVANSLHYRWDFNGNLKSSADENDLRLSDLATQNGATENYSFEENNTQLYVDKTLSKEVRPDFTMAYPVTVSNETDWSIEWRAKFTSSSVILGLENSNGKNNFLYNVYGQSTAIDFFDNVVYPLRFNDCNGDSIFLSYGNSTYANMNKEMNTWKLDYKKYTGKMTLSVLVNDVWTIVDVVEPGEFTATYNNVLGRFNEGGTANFTGWIDYLDIIVSPAEVLYDTHYRWDFESGSEYDSTYDKNTLTKTDDSHTIADGDYVTSGKAGELKMENAVVLDDKHDWMIETEFSTSENNVILIGLENCHLSSGYESHIYFSSTGYKGVRIEPDPNAGSGITVPFNDSTAVNTAMKQMNKWRIGYEVVTDTLTVYMYNTTTGAWDEAGKLEAAPSFTVTSDCLFGDYSGDNKYNMNGTVKYFDVLVEAQKTVNEREYVYDWDFSSWESRGLQNTLTPGETSGDLSSGKYTTTSRGDELALQVPISLDSTKDWAIEWRSSFSGGSTSNSLFGTECCTNSAGKTMNHIYLAAGTYTGDFKSPARIHFSDGTKEDLQFVKDATSSTAAKALVNEWNTWKIEYDSATSTLSLQLYDSETAAWTVCDSCQKDDFSLEFTRMFGDFGSKTAGGNNFVNMYGSFEYVTVRYTVSD